MSISLDSKIKFKELCLLFEKIVKAKGTSQKFLELQKFIRQCNNYARKIRAENPDADTSVYPIFRLILPSLERERGAYGLKTKNLRSLYMRVFCLGKNSANAEKLMNYKKASNAVGKADDFAETVYWLLRPRLQGDENSGLTIQAVNKFLDDVAGAQQNRDEIFRHFTRNISGIELKWLTRLLLKELKLGLSQKKVFEAVHPSAEELFNVTSNLRRVCERFAAWDPSDSASSGIEIELFSHVKPMLLERLRIEQIGRLFVDGQQYYAQIKYDGERSQMHFKDGRFKYFTRQGYDITGNASFGEYADEGKFLTSSVAGLLNLDCRSLILDGELMGWHKQRRSFGSKGLSYDVKKLTESSSHQPCFVAYDVLLYNDELLIHKPYHERLKKLEAAFTERTGVLMLCKNSLISKEDQLVKIFNEALQNDDEGVVIKGRDCFYRPNVREKSGCFKIKAEYSDGLVQDLDLLILGGYYGGGRCSGIMNSFLVGIAHEPTNKNGLPSEFSAVTRVSSGLSSNDLKMIQTKYKPYFTDRKPNGIIGPKSEPPDLWISPKHSLVLKLRATEIIRTDSYPIGYSLRFPRVLEVRLDKPWHNTCSKNEFMSLIKNRGGVQKLTKRKVTAADIDDIGEDEEKPPKIRKMTMLTSKVCNGFVSDRTLEVSRVSRLFEGKEFSVINGDTELSTKDISVILKEHMAKEVQNPGENTFCILVGDPTTLRAETKISSQKYDVVSVAWLKRATRPENLSKIQEFYPWEMYSMRPSTKRRLDELYDPYWDNYEEDVDEKSLERIMKKAEQSVDQDNEIPISKMKKMDKCLFGDEVSPISMFRGMVGYFHNQSDTEKYYFTFMSGIVKTELSACVNYIFLNEEVSEDFIQRYKREADSLNGEKSIPILKSKWINDCFANQKLLPTENYVVSF